MAQPWGIRCVTRGAELYPALMQKSGVGHRDPPRGHWLASLVWERTCLRSKTEEQKECTLHWPPTSCTHAHAKGRASIGLQWELAYPWTNVLGTACPFCSRMWGLLWDLPDAIGEFFSKRRQFFHSRPPTKRLNWCAWEPTSRKPEMRAFKVSLAT